MSTLFESRQGNERLAAQSAQDERFLYLYLSLMIAVFSIITMLNLEVERVTEERSSHTLLGDEIPPLMEHAFSVFGEESAEIDLGGYEALLFLLRSHDINAVVSISGSSLKPELSYARALTLQARLEQDGLNPNDVRVEVGFLHGGAGDTTVTLYRYS